MKLKRQLVLYENKLVELQGSIEKMEKKQPEGILKASRHGNCYQYYVRENEHDRQGTYLSKKDIQRAQLLAQKEYDHMLLEELKIELENLRAFKKALNNRPWERVMKALPEAKRVLVKSLVLSDEEYALRWIEQEYDSLPFRDGAPEFYTQKGERVRSKSEIIIANLLAEANVPYLYEKPLKIKKTYQVYPDFTTLKLSERREIIWEHLGMMDDVEYRNTAFAKIREYEANGYYPGVNLIITFETSKYPIDVNAIRKMIKEIYG